MHIYTFIMYPITWTLKLEHRARDRHFTVPLPCFSESTVEEKLPTGEEDDCLFRVQGLGLMV